MGNLAERDLNGNEHNEWGPQNTSPFNNLQAVTYWSGTEYAPLPIHAWTFYFDQGYQDFDRKDRAGTGNENYHALAVLPGDVSAPLEVGIDIKPGSCLNSLNVKSKGVLPVAILVAILGTADFDVTEVDVASIRLNGVAPIRSNIEDVTQPDDCYDLGSDGWDDLTLKFKTQDIVSAIGNVNDGDEIILELTGNLKEEFGGTAIRGEDVVAILKKGKK